MKEYLLFIRFDLKGDINTFQGDYDTPEEAFEAAKSYREEAYYKIISFKTYQILAEGQIKNLIELLPIAAARVEQSQLLSPVPSG